jgi:hypothetical protein
MPVNEIPPELNAIMTEGLVGLSSYSKILDNMKILMLKSASSPSFGQTASDLEKKLKAS